MLPTISLSMHPALKFNSTAKSRPAGPLDPMMLWLQIIVSGTFYWLCIMLVSALVAHTVMRLNYTDIII